MRDSEAGAEHEYSSALAGAALGRERAVAATCPRGRRTAPSWRWSSTAFPPKKSATPRPKVASASPSAATKRPPPRACSRKKRSPAGENPGILQSLGAGSMVPSRLAEHARLLSGISGELEQSLQAVDGVVSARVHLAAPERARSTTPSRRKPSASVLIRHRGAAPPLATSDVQRLVAGAVPGLARDGRLGGGEPRPGQRAPRRQGAAARRTHHRDARVAFAAALRGGRRGGAEFGAFGGGSCCCGRRCGAPRTRSVRRARTGRGRPVTRRAPQTPAIALRDLHVAFSRPVLRDINLEIPRGCLYGLIGPGASGKSVAAEVPGRLASDRRAARCACWAKT